MRKLVSDHVQAGTIWTTSWDTLPAPQPPTSTKPSREPVFTQSPKKALSKREQKRHLKEQRYGSLFSMACARSPVCTADARGRKKLAEDLNKSPTKKKRKIVSPWNDDDVSPSTSLSAFSLAHTLTLLRTSSPCDLAVSAALLSYIFQAIPMSATPTVGTCEELEKDYFRLLDEPDPSTIRPVKVLEKSLEMVKRRWREGSVDYLYICNQLKSIRQDLVIQAVKSDFTLEVYQTHARLALENKDYNEFNQCQTKVAFPLLTTLLSLLCLCLSLFQALLCAFTLILQDTRADEEPA